MAQYHVLTYISISLLLFLFLSLLLLFSVGSQQIRRFSTTPQQCLATPFPKILRGGCVPMSLLWVTRNLHSWRSPPPLWEVLQLITCGEPNFVRIQSQEDYKIRGVNEWFEYDLATRRFYWTTNSPITDVNGGRWVDDRTASLMCARADRSNLVHVILPLLPSHILHGNQIGQWLPQQQQQQHNNQW